MFHNRSVDVHQFSMVPRADIPRSSFRMEHDHKTTFDSGYLIPIFCEEILPGDSMKLRMTAFCRLATPIFPLMDNLHLESFFFFVPNRLVWSNWKRFMGEQLNPGDSISFQVPQLGINAATGSTIGLNTIYDYMGIPTVEQFTGGGNLAFSVLPFRAYNLIYNEWFRDENLVNSATVTLGDSGDQATDFVLRRRGKRHDYFTSCLPWPQKGNTSVSLPLGQSATVKAGTTELVTGVQTAGMMWRRVSDGAIPAANTLLGVVGAGPSSTRETTNAATGTSVVLYPTNLFADLSTATAATINQIRQAFQIQRLLERDARGGTRYIEIILSHFGVRSPDARLQRPEYLGGGHSPIAVNPIAQTSATGLTGATTPLGTLAAMGTSLAAGHGFSQSFTEHGYVIGLINVRADLTYQRGLRRHWSRLTRYDFYFPAFAMLGEQAVLNKEIYADGSPAGNDIGVFGYQERWAEYRYHPSRISGQFKSSASSPLDAWHLAQKFTSLPTLNQTFIEENPPVDRILAVASQVGKQFYADCFFDVTMARPMPLYSVPGMIDHF